MPRKNLTLLTVLTAALFVAWIVHGQSPQLPDMVRSEFPADSDNEAMFLISVGEKTGQPEDWSGEILVSKGVLEALRGYKFDARDKVLPPNRWQVKARATVLNPRRNIYYPTGYGGESSVGVVITLRAEPGCSIEVKTTRGDFRFDPPAMRVGDRREAMDDDVIITRMPVTRRIGSTWWNDDFPSLAADRQGGLWVVWTGYHGDRDEVGLRHYSEGKWSNYMPVPGNQGDVWWPQVLIDENDNPWVIFSQQDEDNWDLYAVRYFKDRNWWSDVERITDHWMADINHQAVIDDEGNIYVVWQALRGKNYDVLFKQRRAGGWSKTYVVTDSAGNDWEPSIALDSRDRAWITWDSYRNGNYDVYLRSFHNGEFGEEIAVADTSRLDKRASGVVDPQDRVWVGWEQGEVNWGKDLGFTEKDGRGMSLGGRRWLGMAVWADGRLQAPAQQPDEAAVVGSGSFPAPAVP